MVIYLLVLCVYLWAFWLLYVLTMGLYRAHLAGRLSHFALVLGSPFLLLAVALDVLANITVASVVFIEPPEEWLVTTRLQRYLAGAADWRQELARRLCTQLLDPFDPSGHHCV